MNSDKKVILIGNGSSVLDFLNGHIIDTFDIVIRFNNFKIKNYEQHVGTKTDYWFTWYDFHLKDNLNLDRIYFHSWVKNKEKDKNYNKIIKKYNNIITVDYDILPEIKLEIPEYPHNSFSTGLIATHLMLKEYNKVYIYGFDWWENRKEHHYNDKAKIGKLHHPKLEYKYFKKFIDLNKISLL